MDTHTIIIITGVVLAVAIVLRILRAVASVIKLALTVAIICAGVVSYQYMTDKNFTTEKLQADLGAAVKTIKEVSPDVITVSKDILATLQKVGANTSFNKNGIVFNDKAGLEGKIIKENSNISFYCAAPVNNDNSVKSMIELTSTFSGNKNVAKIFKELKNGKKEAKIDINNGYIASTKDSRIEVYISKPLP